MYAERSPSAGMVRLTHLIYALHAFAVFSGVVGSASVIGSFIASIPSLAAIVLNYWNRGAVRNTWLDSHFDWQIRTFWYTVAWVVLSVLLAVTLIGLPFALMALTVVSLWVIYRVARGWWRLSGGLRMPAP